MSPYLVVGSCQRGFEFANLHDDCCDSSRSVGDILPLARLVPRFAGLASIIPRIIIHFLGVLQTVQRFEKVFAGFLESIG